MRAISRWLVLRSAKRYSGGGEVKRGRGPPWLLSYPADQLGAVREHKEKSTMRSRVQGRHPLSILLAILAVVLATAGQAGATGSGAGEKAARAETAGQAEQRAQAAEPEDAEIPPTFIGLPCNEDYLGVVWTDWVNILGGDYILWECSWGTHMKYFWRIVAIRNAQEDAERFAKEGWRFFKPTWQGLVLGGIGQIDLDGDPRNDNVDTVASFDLRGPSGSPIYRTIATRLLVAVSKNQGPWNACSDTGWNQAPPNTFFWETKLQYNGPKCGTGRYSAWAAGRFKSVSTGQWVTTDWVKTDPIAIVVPPPNGPE